MKKEGFVFLESVVVLVVVMLALTMLLLTYSLITRRTEEKEDYNKASDIYLLYSINKMGATEKEYYKVETTDDENEIKKLTTDRQYPFSADKDTCDLTYMGKLLGTTTDSNGEVINECSRLFDTTDLVKIYTVYDVFRALNDQELTRVITKTNDTKTINAVYEAINKYDNGTIEYMKTLPTCKVTNIQRDENGNPKYDKTTGQLLYEEYKESVNTSLGKINNNCAESYHYMIGVFKRSGTYYYASIEIPGIEYTILLDSGKNVSSPGNKYLILKSGSGYYDRNDIQVDKITIPLMEGKAFSGYYEDKNECSKELSNRKDQIIDSNGNIKVSSSYFNKDTKLTACWENTSSGNDDQTCKYDGELVQDVEYENGQYTYTYNGNTGWAIKLTNKSSTEDVTSKICTTINGKPIVSTKYMFSESQATKVDLSSLDTSNVTDMVAMFYRSKIQDLDLSGFDTSNVTSMAAMFGGSKATMLDLSNFDTSKVTNMNGMFSSSEAREIKFGDKFNTINVKNMGFMFADSYATTLDLRNFDTRNVTDMNRMFRGSKATTLDVSSFDTSKVTDMSYMFSSSDAREIKFSSNFNTKSVTNMSYMFSGSKATTLDVSSFDTSNVTNMRNMFSSSIENSATRPIEVETIIGLEKFDTSKVTNMTLMFNNSKLKILDLSSFDTSKVTDMSYMFSNCKATTGYARTQEEAKKFNTSGDMPSGLTFTVK